MVSSKISCLLLPSHCRSYGGLSKPDSIANNPSRHQHQYNRKSVFQMSHIGSHSWTNSRHQKIQDLSTKQRTLGRQKAALERKMATLSMDHQQMAFAQRMTKRKKKFPSFELFPESLAEERAQQNAIRTATTNLHVRKVSTDGQSLPITVPPLSGLNCYPVPALTQQSKTFDQGTGLLGLPEVETLVKSPVLAQPTIWQPCFDNNKVYYTSPRGIYDWTITPIGFESPSSTMQVLVAEWPTEQEYRFESDDRVRTSAAHRRFLPVPRKRTNPTVAWNMLPFLQQHELDRVSQAPSHEQVLWNYYEGGYEDVGGEDQIRSWLGNELWSQLIPDEYTIW